MNVPPEAWRWIKEHRTHLDPVTLQQAYKDSLAEDYRMMLPYLSHCDDILDIGCGMAGIDLFLYYHYRKQVHLHLMDGTGDTRIKVGYNPSLKPYNHLGITKKLLLMNNVDENHINFHPINPELTIPCDLIISLLSWGFHYPADTYCNLAERSLRSGGKLILDIRMNTDYDCLKEKFIPIRSIYIREGKFARIVFKAR